VSLLAKVQRGGTPRPPRLLVYGTPGIGKSTFRASAPSPIFVPTEDGLDEINCAKFPLATSYEDVSQALGDLAAQPHDFGTVVLDSLDWLEWLIWDRVCAEFSVKNIEKADGGYANLGNEPPFLKKHGLYFSQGIVWVKEHPVLTRKDSRGSRVERVGFGWERGKV